MLVYGTQLVVLPFRKDTLTDEQEGMVGERFGPLSMWNGNKVGIICGRF